MELKEACKGVYRYQDDEGQEHAGSGNVVEPLWNQLEQGQPVQITYLRNQPANSWPVGRPFTERWLWLILLTTGSFIVAAFVGLWVIAGRMRLRRRKAREVREGMDSVSIHPARSPD